MAFVIAPRNGLEIVPRLWMGDNYTCDQARQDLSWTCINVGETSHTADPRCIHIAICATATTPVSNAQLVAMQRVLINAFANPNQKALIHGPDGMTYSPLATALWLEQRYSLTMAQAYEWILAKQPKAQVLDHLAPPRGSW